MSCVVIASDGHLVVDNRVLLRAVVKVQTKYLGEESLDQLCATLL